VSAPRRFLRVVLLVVVVVLAAAAYFRYRLENPPAGAGSEEVIVEIPPGTSTSDIFRRLARAGVVEDARLAEVYYRLHRRRIPLQAGEYRFHRAMPIDEVINRMGRGDVVKHAVVVPEGLTAEETFELFSKQGIGGPDAFQAALVKTELVPGLTHGVSDLEGFLFPDTYVVTRTTPASQIVDRMVANFGEHFTPDLQRRAGALGLTTRQAVTLASIVERESGVKSEGPLIAGVYLNRLRRGMRLRSDGTDDGRGFFTGPTTTTSRPTTRTCTRACRRGRSRIRGWTPCGRRSPPPKPTISTSSRTRRPRATSSRRRSTSTSPRSRWRGALAPRRRSRSGRRCR